MIDSDVNFAKTKESDSEERSGIGQWTLCVEVEEEKMSHKSHQRSHKDVILIYARSSLRRES